MRLCGTWDAVVGDLVAPWPDLALDIMDLALSIAVGRSPAWPAPIAIHERARAVRLLAQREDRAMLRRRGR